MPLNTLAWNNKIGPRGRLVGLHREVMINRYSWGYSYLIVRGESLAAVARVKLPKKPRITVA